MNGRQLLRYGGRHAAAVASRGIRALYNVKRSQNSWNSRVKRTKYGGSGYRASLGITNQLDVKRMYKGRRTSRRVVRRWRRFQKRVNKAVSNQIPTQIELMRGHLDITSAINTQQTFACMLYGEAGVAGATNDLGAQDLTQIITDSATLVTTATNKIIFKSAYLDMYITNTGLVPAGTTIYVDIYTIYCRKDVYQYNGASDFLANTYADSANLTGTTALTNTAFGVTPFQNPMFCSHFKIGEVKRVVLEPGQTYNTQMKDRKSKIYYFGKTEKVVCLKGWTKGFLCVFKGSSGYNSQDVASNVAVEALRTYTYDYTESVSQKAGYRNV